MEAEKAEIKLTTKSPEVTKQLITALQASPLFENLPKDLVTRAPTNVA